ncbi:uncharacterized protein LOC113233279 [Hyposmocoma kahamanoa]|uniref:uncharacterized protein LOC113233279 n=1 Tax=Hyposmocoma kahamanoa TaxID=1477025 RepID=UPI000E6D7FC5|nr:uncharacterized protein LOC113233279 [Hyposmocoma kahamanoa]
MYSDYKTYADVKAIEKWEPTPVILDECFVALSSYEYKNRNRKVKFCELPVSCKNVLKTGTDVGFALSHRILFLAAARLGVGCFLLGKLQDDVLKGKLCREAYDEGRYIAMNGYDFIGLMMEYVAVCSMLGHTEFLRRDWLEESIRHQTTAGCFNDPSNAIDKDVSHEMERPCDMHVTGVSVAAITSAVRWILETDYFSDNTIYEDKKMPLLPFLRRDYLINSD